MTSTAPAGSDHGLVDIAIIGGDTNPNCPSFCRLSDHPDDWQCKEAL